MVFFDFDLPFLSSPSHACNHAARVIACLLNGQEVMVDVVNVQAMTPSFVNTWVMTILDAVPRDVIRQNLRVANASPHVAYAINRSIERFDSGIRLSNQRRAS